MPAYPTLPDGLQSIALSFSGGGYRAAFFSLGCVSYLNCTPSRENPLLHKVKFISSASGGTITNLVLCSMLREGKSFEDIYKHLIEQLTGCGLVDEVFKIWENQAAWSERPEKTRNFINAFAMIYDRDLFGRKTFDSLLRQPSEGQFVIEETCVNTTEFNNGLNFRFGTAGVMGNEFLNFPKSGHGAARKIKLADILACSSCFTAGFEPLMFPRDFTWQNANCSLTKEELSSAIHMDNTFNDSADDPSEEDEPVIGFMDGGIDDNQGIYAFILSDGRQKGYAYDLYLPCDVSSNFLKKPFRYPAIKELPILDHSIDHWLGRIRKVRNLYVVGCILLLVLSLGGCFFSSVPQAGYLLLGISLTALALPFLLYLFVKGEVKAALRTFFPPGAADKPGDTFSLVFKKHLATFRKMPLHDLLILLIARGKSVVLLATTIFLKKIRRVSYSLLFKDKSLDIYRQVIAAHNKNPQPVAIDAGRLWNDHIAMSAVYQLSTKNARQLLKDLRNEPWHNAPPMIDGSDQPLTSFILPSDNLRQVVDIATEMDTTLWFHANHQAQRCPESLLAAGQATMCFNLLRVSYRFGNTDSDWSTLRQKLVDDWKRFKEEPYWLYNKYGQSAGLVDFKPI